MPFTRITFTGTRYPIPVRNARTAKRLRCMSFKTAHGSAKDESKIVTNVAGTSPENVIHIMCWDENTWNEIKAAITLIMMACVGVGQIRRWGLLDSCVVEIKAK